MHVMWLGGRQAPVNTGGSGVLKGELQASRGWLASASAGHAFKTRCANAAAGHAWNYHILLRRARHQERHRKILHLMVLAYSRRVTQECNSFLLPVLAKEQVNPSTYAQQNPETISMYRYLPRRHPQFQRYMTVQFVAGLLEYLYWWYRELLRVLRLLLSSKLKSYINPSSKLS